MTTQTKNKMILVTCMNKDCNNSFRIPEYRFNSTIKNNPDKQECNYCKSKARIIKNKKILSQANLPGQNKQSYSATGKYIAQQNKRKKTPKDRFYSSAAWRWFSRYVLMYYSLDGEVVQCCTCKNHKRVNDRKMHVGHWIKVFNANSSNYSVAFEFTNVMGQCLQCNKFMGGRENEMMEVLESVHGLEEVNRLRRLSKQPFHLDGYTLDKISKEYREKFYQLLEERGYKNPWKK